MASVAEGIAEPPIQEHLRAEIQTFVQEHRQTLQFVGIAAAIGVGGVVGGLLMAKGMIVGKGATAANLALAGKGAAATKGSVAPLSHLLMSDGGTLTTSISNSTALADKANSLWHLLSSNVLPLSIGAVGGGAAGLSVKQSDILTLRQRLAEERDTTEQLQHKIDKLNRALVDETPQKSDIEELLPPPTQPTATPAAEEATEEASKANPVELQPVQNEPATQQPPTIPPSERLERIHGIGRVFAQRLREAGIHTVSELAIQEPTTIETIIGQTRAGAMFEPKAWIAEAKHLTISSDGDSAPIENPSLPTETVTFVLERLEAIAGLSSAVAARLNRAGIFTYSELAAQQPEQIAVILGEDESHKIDEIAAWISAAQTVATKE